MQSPEFVTSFLPILREVLPVFCIAAIGASLRKIDWLTEEADETLLRITVNVLIPSLIFSSILENEALRRPENVILPPLVGFFTVCLGLGLASLARPWLQLQETRQRRTFTYSTAVYNYGYVPIPLTILLFDSETVGVLFVHNVGVEFAMWSVGLAVLTAGHAGSFWRKLINAPLVAIAIGLTLNLSGGQGAVPPFVVKTAEMLGDCAIPVGLMLVGATIADYIHQFQAAWHWRLMSTACLLRLGILPVLFLALAAILPASLELKRVMVLQAAMPAASFPILIAKHYGGDANTALQIVLSTSLIGFLTIPLWISLGTWLVL